MKRNRKGSEIEQESRNEEKKRLEKRKRKKKLREDDMSLRPMVIG